MGSATPPGQCRIGVPMDANLSGSTYTPLSAHHQHQPPSRCSARTVIVRLKATVLLLSLVLPRQFLNEKEKSAPHHDKSPFPRLLVGSISAPNPTSSASFSTSCHVQHSALMPHRRRYSANGPRRSPRAEIDCAALLRVPAEARLVRRSRVSDSFFFSSLIFCEAIVDTRLTFFSPFFFVAFLVGGSNSQVHFSMTNLLHRMHHRGLYRKHDPGRWAALVLLDRIGAGGG
jgi:hypothetical protein